MSTLPISPERDLSKGRHNANSQAAFKSASIRAKGMRQRILDEIDARGDKGLTLAEACELFKKLPHQISGRFSQLAADDKIEQAARLSRNGHGVWKRKAKAVAP